MKSSLNDLCTRGFCIKSCLYAQKYIKKKNFDPWHPRQTQLEKYRPLYSSILEKIYSATDHRQDLSRSVFGFKFQDVAYSFSSDPVSLYHGTKSNNINQLLNVPASYSFHTKCKSIIILEKCSITGAKCFSLLDNISCFNDFPAVSYYKVLRIGLIYGRIDAIFDHYLDWSFKEATRITGGARKRFRFTDLSKNPKSFESFYTSARIKKNLNEYVAEKFIMMHENQDTPLQSKEGDQWLILYTLHCLSSCFSYEKIVIDTIDADVMILLNSIPIRYFSKEFKCFSLC